MEALGEDGAFPGDWGPASNLLTGAPILVCWEVGRGSGSLPRPRLLDRASPCPRCPPLGSLGREGLGWWMVGKKKR